jgi:TetR/AcrR family transcriptional repressor of nem operon
MMTARQALRRKTEPDFMRMSREEKKRSHARIVESAARIVRAEGIERPTVADFMKAAGMTHGGFYRHFETRDQLILAAFQAASADRAARFEQMKDALGPEAAAAAFKADYLTDSHVENPEAGCHLAALAGDVARGPDALKAMFGSGVRYCADALAGGMEGSDQERREQALREFAMIAGAIMVARAADPQTAHALLAACRKGSPEVGSKVAPTARRGRTDRAAATQAAAPKRAES